MITSRHLAGTALIISWAMLISARCIAAATYATKPSNTYDSGLDRIGNFMPIVAWIALFAGLFLLLGSHPWLSAPPTSAEARQSSVSP